MSENQISTTELTSQYIAQVTSDLERNGKEQERIATDIAALQEQLLALQHDHTVLVTMHQALGGTSPVAGTTSAVPSVPSQSSARTKQPKAAKEVKEVKTAKPKKAAATIAKKAEPKKAGAKKPATGGTAAKASKATAQPSLVDLIRGHLEAQNEPRSAAEITTALTAAHPERTIKTTVVRTTLENLVARSSAHRNKQGSSVFYTAATEAAAKAEPAAAAN
ncbi:hypothetical protein J8N05_43855 [Streptomyces sp. BH-SS-21]|uniref:Regulatory protein n=1 Tax=Streptomyces liliiviolaceus TaxID=2823109 RepID=A0A941BIN4_9ACTN|nr:hypothetical protein [Streptomyces liliiviolaceus]MBQ0855104.1 hypothetical protein [Streptomyces liliiviolaceus]